VAGATVPLAYTEWTLVELAGVPLELTEGERPPHLVLDLEESRVTGSGGCNRLTGTFALSADELRFGPLATTRMACPEPAMERAALDRVTSYALDERALTLVAGNEAVARLQC
jgi:heat shock protein HslJ